MITFPEKLEQLLETDLRYDPWGYIFVHEGIGYATAKFARGKQKVHLKADQLCKELCNLALKNFGYLARITLKQWGIETTRDIGEIVYNLIECKMITESAGDMIDDFNDLFNLEEELNFDQQISEYRFAT